MPRPMFTLLVLTTAFVVFGCKDRHTAPIGSASTTAPPASAGVSAVRSAAPSATPSAKKLTVLAPPGVEVSEEMRDFVLAVAEDHKLNGAIQRFAAPSLDDHGLGHDPIESPKVVGTDPSAGNCYILEGVDGPAIHDYLVCWDNKQIIQFADRGMK